MLLLFIHWNSESTPKNGSLGLEAIVGWNFRGARFKNPWLTGLEKKKGTPYQLTTG